MENNEPNQQKSSIKIKIIDFEKEFHLEHQKLLILERLSQYSVQQLRCLSSEEENIARLDLTKVFNQLLNDKECEVSYPKYREGIKCKKKDHQRQQTISKCLPPSCKFMCGDCANVTKACCKSCELCLKCALNNLDLKDWRKFITKLVDGGQISDVCETLLLRSSIILLRMFRNFESHSTDAEYKEIDKGIINDAEISQFFNSWADIQRTYRFAIKQVLDYLKKKSVISEENMTYFIKLMDKVVAATKHSELKKFDVDDLQEILKKIKNEIEVLSSSVKKSIKVIVEFEFKDKKKFNMEDSDYYKHFKSATESYFRKELNKSNMVKAKLCGEKSQSHDPKSFYLTFKIESGDVDLDDYTDFNDVNEKAKNLWKTIKEELNNSLAGILQCTLKSWDKGSIIIGVAINKASNEEWDEYEMVEIEEKMTKFAAEFKFTGDLSTSTMTLKSERKCRKNTFCLVYQLDAFSVEMATELANIDKDRFVAFLQDEMANLEGKISKTGMDIVLIIKDKMYFHL